MLISFENTLTPFSTVCNKGGGLGKQLWKDKKHIRNIQRLMLILWETTTHAQDWTEQDPQSFPTNARRDPEWGFPTHPFPNFLRYNVTLQSTNRAVLVPMNMGPHHHPQQPDSQCFRYSLPSKAGIVIQTSSSSGATAFCQKKGGQRTARKP